MLTHTIITLLTTLTLLQCFQKWGWIDWYTTYRDKWMPEGECALCMGFWLSIVVAGLYYIASLYHVEALFIPFACAGLINFIFTFLSVLKHENH